MVTSPDPVDYRALLPSLSWVLFHEENIQLESNSEIEIDLIVNRAGRSTGRFDPAIELKKILNDFKEKAFPDGREIREELYTYLYERGKKFGALACRHVPDFNMEKILLTIIRLKEKKFADYKGMEDLCRQIGKIAGLYEE
jgi:hypothetical protein